MLPFYRGYRPNHWQNDITSSEYYTPRFLRILANIGGLDQINQNKLKHMPRTETTVFNPLTLLLGSKFSEKSIMRK